MTPEAALELSQRYAQAHQRFLDAGGEASLALANEMGRAANREGLGVLDMLAMHQKAVAAAALDPSQKGLAQKSLEFLAESLAPFEMTQKGFRESLAMSQLKSQLVSLVSHEFANALSVIQCALIFLEDDRSRGDSANRPHVFEILKTNVRALSMASTNLLNMGRLEAGKFKLQLRRTAVRSLVRKALERLEVMYQRKGITLSLDLPRAPVAVLADPEALNFVITNLLSNAIKYTPDGGKITIGLTRLDDSPPSALLFFQDTGIGIPDEEKEKIFSGFYRTQKGRETSEGFGVGLTLARKIVEAHGSRLLVDSTPGKGSTFYFSLPVVDAAPGEAPNGNARPQKLRPARVLNRPVLLRRGPAAKALEARAK